MHKYINIIAILTLLFYSGCSGYLEPKVEAESNATRKVEIVLLHKQVKELNTKDKQLIYKSIQDDIHKYNKEGNEAHENGYNHDAIKAYELVNFYEGYSYIPKKKIRKLKKVAKKRTLMHYKKALKYFKTNKKRAVSEFNLVMKNNPNYKKTKKKLEVLNMDRNIKIFINSMQSTLHTRVLNCNGSISELKIINQGLHKLLKYDYNNSVALNAREVLKEYKGILLIRAKSIYEKGQLTKAKKRFKKILEIYKNDATSLKYLAKIKVKKSIYLNLQLAENALNKKRYLKSIKYARSTLKIESNNKKAKSIIVKAKKEAALKVSFLVNQGKKQYSSKNLDESKKSFKAALKIDANCNEALIYSKKIDRQLKTIKSLQ